MRQLEFVRSSDDREIAVHDRRDATWAGQIVSALELQSVTVAGTDAAAMVLPHLARQLIAPRAQRADVTPPRPVTLAGGPPSCARS